MIALFHSVDIIVGSRAINENRAPRPLIFAARST